MLFYVVHYAISLMIISFPHQYKHVCECECAYRTVYVYVIMYMSVDSNIFNQKRSYQISKRSTFRPNLDNTQKAIAVLQHLHEKVG